MTTNSVRCGCACGCMKDAPKPRFVKKRIIAGGREVLQGTTPKCFDCVDGMHVPVEVE